MGFGKVVVSFRKKWSMDQEALGDAVGVSKTYISLIENDKRTPLRTIKKIAEFFEVPFAHFAVEAYKAPLLKSKSKKLNSAIQVTEPVLKVLIDHLASREDAKSRELLIPPQKRKKAKKKE